MGISKIQEDRAKVHPGVKKVFAPKEEVKETKVGDKIKSKKQK